MSSKELMYVEDSLNHAEFLATRFKEASNQLTDPQLKANVSRLAAKSGEIFSKFYGLV